MSASSRPVLAPRWARLAARLMDTADLPTPPLPEATMMTFFTPGRRSSWSSWPDLLPRVLAPISTSTSSTPATRPTAASQSCWILDLSGQAGVVNSTVRDTRPPSTWISLIMPRLTRSWSSSGSMTSLRACLISSMVGILLAAPLMHLYWRFLGEAVFLNKLSPSHTPR